MGSANATGRRAERAAERLLRRRGWTILARNWRGGGGEIDIVAGRRGVLAVCEVKARGSGGAWRDESVAAAQRGRIVAAAAAFVARHPHLAGHATRFDVLVVTPGRLRRRVRHVRGAFEPREGRYACGARPYAAERNDIR